MAWNFLMDLSIIYFTFYYTLEAIRISIYIIRYDIKPINRLNKYRIT